MWRTPAAFAAAIAASCCAVRSRKSVALTSSNRSPPANASRNVVGAVKSARRTATPRAAKLIASGVRA
jgi:hypothetical protein